jgi:plastocyanin
MNNDTLNDMNQPSVSTEKKKKTGLIVVISALVIIAAAAILYVVNPGGVFPSLTDEADDTAMVMITNAGFSPETIKIKKGQTIEWMNQDATPHQVASDPYPDHSVLPHLFSEQPLAQNESFNYTFEKSGTFTYHDNLKPVDFKGTVVVE